MERKKRHPNMYGGVGEWMDGFGRKKAKLSKKIISNF